MNEILRDIRNVQVLPPTHIDVEVRDGNASSIAGSMRLLTSPPQSPPTFPATGSMRLLTSPPQSPPTFPRTSVTPLPTTVLPTTSVTHLCGQVAHGDPAVGTWIEARIDSAMRNLIVVELPKMISCAKREAQATVHTTLQQVEIQLRSEVRHMWETQSRVLVLFEAITKEAERFFNNGKNRSEAMSTIEQVMSTIDELHRSVGQDVDGAAAKLRQHEATIIELKKEQAQESAKQKAALFQIHLQQQKQCNDLASACNTIVGTQQEAGGLAQLVQQLEVKLSSWRAEIAAEVADELRAMARQREVEAETERFNTDTFYREIRQAMAGCSGLEARLEGLRLELSNVSNARAELERWFQESHERNLESSREETEGLLQNINRIEQRTNAWEADVSKERASMTAVHDEIQRLRNEAIPTMKTLRCEVTELASGLEAFRREVASIFENFFREASESNSIQNKLEGSLQKLQAELLSLVTSQDACQVRNRESHEELREELSTLQHRITSDVQAEIRVAIKSEQKSITAIDEQLWLTDQRLGQRIDELAHALERTAVMVQVHNERSGAKLSPMATRTFDTIDRRVINATTVGRENHPKVYARTLHVSPDGNRRELYNSSSEVGESYDTRVSSTSRTLHVSPDANRRELYNSSSEVGEPYDTRVSSTCIRSSSEGQLVRRRYSS